MATRRPGTGDICVTASGLSVRVEAARPGALIVTSLASGNRYAISAAYPLKRVQRGAPVLGGAVPARASGPPLSAVIDSLLVRGELTMRGILRETRRKASAACRGKDLPANVRARVYWLRAKGYRIEKDSNGHLRAHPCQVA